MAMRETNSPQESAEQIKTPEMKKTSAENLALARIQEMETEVEAIKETGTQKPYDNTTKKRLESISKKAEGLMVDTAKEMQGALSASERALKAKTRRPSYIDEWVAEKEKMLFAEEGTEYEPIQRPKIGVEGLQRMQAERMAGLAKIGKVMEEMEKDKEKGAKGFYRRVEDLYNVLPDEFEDTPEINEQINKVLTYSKRFLDQHSRHQIRLSGEQVDAVQSIIDILSKDKKDIKEKLTPLFEEEIAA